MAKFNPEEYNGIIETGQVDVQDVVAVLEIQDQENLDLHVPTEITLVASNSVGSEATLEFVGTTTKVVFTGDKSTWVYTQPISRVSSYLIRLTVIGGSLIRKNEITITTLPARPEGELGNGADTIIRVLTITANSDLGMNAIIGTTPDQMEQV